MGTYAFRISVACDVFTSDYPIIAAGFAFKLPCLALLCLSLLCIADLS